VKADFDDQNGIFVCCGDNIKCQRFDGHIN